MKRLLWAAAALPLLASPAFANDWYVKASVGQSFNNEASGFSLSDDLAYGAALGTSVGPVRVEAGVDRISADSNFAGLSIDASAVDYSATAYLDLPVGSKASVYVGAGVDYVQADADAIFFSDSGEGSGYHLTVGGAYRLSDSIIAEAQVRRLSADVSMDAIGDVDLESYVASVGFRFAL